MRRVWDWLEVSGSREQSLGLGSSSDAMQFGQMHLSEGSPATTVITTALDASRCDAVEPCVSSLPDAQVRSLLRRRAPSYENSLYATTTATHLLGHSGASRIDAIVGTGISCGALKASQASCLAGNLQADMRSLICLSSLLDVIVSHPRLTVLRLCSTLTFAYALQGLCFGHGATCEVCAAGKHSGHRVREQQAHRERSRAL